MEKNNPDELRFQNLSPHLVNTIANIAANLGITINDMLRPKLRNIIDKYPEYLKKELSDQKCREIRIRGVAPTIVKDLNTIAKNLSVNATDIFSIEAAKIIEEYPEKFRKPPAKF